MIRLFSLLYTFIGATVAGSFVIAALVMNMFDPRSIVVAAALGFLVGIPVSWGVAKKLSEG